MQSISFITATPFVPRILDTLELWRPRVPVVWNTSGYETVETLRRLEGAVDVYLPDLKHYSPRLGGLIARAPDYFEAASAAIREMVRQCGVPQYSPEGIMTRGVLIRHLILPGCTSDSIRLLQWVRDELPEGIPVSLMQQYVPCNDVAIPGLQRRITPREYHRVCEYMREIGLPGFTQGATSATVDFVPVFNQDESFVQP